MKGIYLFLMVLAWILSVPAFAGEVSTILNYKCHKGAISNAGKAELKSAVAENRIDLGTFKAVYFTTCDFQNAIKISAEEMNHTVFLNVFNDTFEYRCSGRDYVTADGAIVLAKAAATQKVNMENFKTVYYSTCDFYKALRIAF